ncbi:hypothetical protein J4E93_009071 [Alternaria ventricosa]|uniref:uncharacterized protein n=1 Tax=Alternaria ventricosa TaxID=1187951 RepID=UPI0020C54EA8|nr:uncharacterized protein J4E93_009071 [Alternaria ventricosa]KAI4639717.1 hypothetical protein J4E93_009071 [Alternaria ventricosa]
MQNNPYDIALQLETTAAQIRSISTLPEAQRDGAVKDALQYLRVQVLDLDEKVHRLDVRHAALNKQVQAHIWNTAMRRYHSTYKYPDMRMGHMRNIQTNEPIIDFPLQARDFRSLDSSECDRIAIALGRREMLGEIEEKQQTVIHLVGLDAATVYNWV